MTSSSQLQNQQADNSDILYPAEQTLCGALLRETNWKCFILTSLIIGCLGAVTWCRVSHVTKTVINFSTYPIKTSRQMSPCDEGYLYIPVAFMAMLYLVYLVECWHCTARVELGHREDSASVLQRIQLMRQSQPIIWWKAVCYHYVRRKRQVTRYRNGDSYTATQVYYERVNSHAAGSSFVYTFCGVKDISKRIVLNQAKRPITKIRFSKGFAFANVDAAADFEEQRARFFAEHERYDDYMEMREGLELSNVSNFKEAAIVVHDPDHPPWFASQPVFWISSACLLSWPLRLLLEYNTAYVHYQVTKLFGVNYDTAPAPALLPPPAPPAPPAPPPVAGPLTFTRVPTARETDSVNSAVLSSDDVEFSCSENVCLIPSYSEALLIQVDEPTPPAPSGDPPLETQTHTGSTQTESIPVQTESIPTGVGSAQAHCGSAPSLRINALNSLFSFNVNNNNNNNNNNSISASSRERRRENRRSWGGIFSVKTTPMPPLTRSSTQNGMLLYYAAPLTETFPNDPFGGCRVTSPVEEPPPPYEEALRFPTISTLTRSLTERGEICRRALWPVQRRSDSTEIRLPDNPPRAYINMETSL
ncbi:transmembrane protein 151B [Bemisia tabaci]